MIDILAIDCCSILYFCFLANYLQISPGQKLTFSQEVVAINTKEKHCCALGELDKRAVVTPDVDSLFHSLDDLDLH